MGLVKRLGGGDNPVTHSLQARLNLAYDMVERRLSEAACVAGSEFTAADIIMLFPLTTMRRFQRRDLAICPNLRAYLQRIADRPAYQRAMARGRAGHDADS